MRQWQLAVGLLALSGLGAGGGVLELPAGLSSTSDFYEQTIVNAGPVVYWRLAEPSGSTAANLGTHGSGGNATYFGTDIVRTTPSPLFNPGTDTAITFPNPPTVTNYVQWSPTASFPHPSSALSYEFWINAANNQGGRGVASFAANATPGPGAGHDNELLLLQPDSLLVFLNGSSIGSGVDVASGDWHHVAITWRSSDGLLTVYRDGVQEFQTNHQAGAPLNLTGAVVLGQEQDTVGGGFAASQALIGSLDEFAIYDRVLSPEEVALHFNIGIGAVLPPPPPLAPEPTTTALLTIALAALAGTHWWRRRGHVR